MELAVDGEVFVESNGHALERSMLENIEGVTLAGSANRHGGVYERLTDPVLSSPERRAGMAREYRKKYRSKLKLKRRVLH